MTGYNWPHDLLCHRLLIVNNIDVITKHAHAPAVSPMTRGCEHPAAVTARITPARKQDIAPRYNIFNRSLILASLSCGAGNINIDIADNPLDKAVGKDGKECPAQVLKISTSEFQLTSFYCPWGATCLIELLMRINTLFGRARQTLACRNRFPHSPGSASSHP